MWLKFMMSPFCLFTKKKYFSDFEAINDSRLLLSKKNKIKLKLGMYSTVDKKILKNNIDLIRYFILKQDIDGLNYCFNKFEKKIFITKKNKLLILTMFFPFLKERVLKYAEKHNLYHILSYSNPKYIQFNTGLDRYLLSINECNNFEKKNEIFKKFMEKQFLNEILFKNKDFSIKSMHGNCENKYSEKRVSIILTVYNGVNYIEVAINSILNQDYVNFELIVVDDASNDGTVEILEKYESKDSRIKVFFLTENIGTYKAKNIALKNANGEYIAFQDADDYSHMSRISESVSLLESNNRILAVSSRYVRITSNGQFVSSKGIPLIRWSPLTLVFHRKILDILVSFDEARFGADSEFFARLIAHFGQESHVILNKVLMFCLDRNDSLMKKNIHFFGFSNDRNIYQDLYTHRILDSLSESERCPN